MKRKSTGNILNRYRYFYKDKRYYKKLLNRIIIVLIILLIVVVFRKISSTFTDNVIRIIKNGTSYEFSIKEDGKKIIEGSKKILIVPEKVKKVFNIKGGNLDFAPPVEGNIYKPFGELSTTREKKIFNKGVDIIPSGDSTIFSVGDGIVTQVEDKNSLGYFVTIKYEDFEAVYGYLKKIYINKGDNVLKGQKIGSLGTNSEGGNRYLHFEIWKNGNPVNPVEIVKLNQ
ncbi:murein hydrolase activator EnvC family protein [Anaerosalibacter sp. Marseille-P3206]|uniref:murein hydrolase activator EnvC family protein n=1 Tax=Anaerosalibacter sp. Marseille-P3206 TaxID=1871005 RepID=UPI0009851EFE|nr:M23 family metallopeptidase [Anaerosalibacter sp. Marseille-P3206]